MQLYATIVILWACCATHSDLWAVAGQSIIPGKFDVYNHKPILLRGSEADQNNKIFSFGGHRAPLLDTPTSKCKCSELRTLINFFIRVAASRLYFNHGFPGPGTVTSVNA